MNSVEALVEHPFGKESDSVKPGKMTIIQPIERIEI